VVSSGNAIILFGQRVALISCLRAVEFFFFLALFIVINGYSNLSDRDHCSHRPGRPLSGPRMRPQLRDRRHATSEIAYRWDRRGRLEWMSAASAWHMVIVLDINGIISCFALLEAFGITSPPVL
jgi:hypothetical protein